MSIFQMCSNASLPVRAARYELGMIGGLFLAKGSFFATLKPLNSAKVPWSKLFALVFFDGLKCLQLRSISLSSCHSLPFCDTFYRKYELSFFKKSEEFTGTRFFNSNWNFWVKANITLELYIKKPCFCEFFRLF